VVTENREEILLRLSIYG